jgi:two-component system, NarL family, response regulator NreC
VSVKTAESHRTNVMQKLGVHETASLVRYAVRRGLIEP